MSGIAGLFHRDKTAVLTSDVDRMLASMAHRGPDGTRSWVEGSIGLGACHLQTSSEAIHRPWPSQPLDPALRIVADARLDNRPDLIEQLALQDASPSDSALILAAYARWGPPCVEKLLGDFAFAIWNGREREWFCARDHFGVRPLVYCLTERFFAFASEPAGLLALPQVPRRLDERQVLEYLIAAWDDVERCFYRDFKKLAPGHWMRVDTDRSTMHRYWSLEAPPRLRLRSDAEYAEAYRELFLTAVRRRVPRGGRVGSTLSGGLDSTAVACATRSELVSGNQAPLHTFSVIFDDVPKSDERQYMQIALATGDMQAHYVQGDRISPLGEIERVLDHVGQPFLGPNIFLHWAMYAAAREAGVKVLFDGLDGDTTVSHGMARLQELARGGRLFSLMRETRAFARARGRPLMQVLRTRVLLPLIPDGWLRCRRRLLRRAPPMSPGQVALSPAFQCRFDAHELERSRTTRFVPRSETENHLWLMRRGLMALVLDLTDRASAAFSVEARYPFFDRHLVEFCLSVPPEQKLRDGWTRWIARRGMEGILPPEICWRTGKSNLSHNFSYSLHRFDVDRIAQIIARTRDRLAEYVDIAALETSHARFAATADPAHGQSLMHVAVLALWLQRTGL